MKFKRLALTTVTLATLLVRDVAGQVPAAISLQRMQAEERGGANPDYGEAWEAIGSRGRIFYVQGFMEGDMNGINEATNILYPECPAPVNKLSHTQITWAGMTVGVIAEVMSALYKDKANAFIPFAQMIYVARTKIRGEDVENALKFSRARALMPPVRLHGRP